MCSCSAHKPRHIRWLENPCDDQSWLHKETVLYCSLPASKVRVRVRGWKKKNGKVCLVSLLKHLQKQTWPLYLFISEWWLWRQEDTQSHSVPVFNKGLLPAVQQTSLVPVFPIPALQSRSWEGFPDSFTETCDRELLCTTSLCYWNVLFIAI